VDTVLGVSITRISAGLVLLEGRIPDGVTVDRDAIDLSGSHASMTDVMAAVLGIQGSVSAKGHRLRAVGVTWSAGSEPKARELVTTLTEFGLTNIVTVRPSEATSTLTRDSRGVDADTAAPVVDIGGDDVAAANSEVPLARGAALALTRNSRGVDADTAAPVVDIGGDDVAAANSEVPLARGAALALARQETAETEHDENLPRERRRPDPSSIAAATILCGGTLAVLAAIWIGVAPRHADSDVGPPAPQQQSAPPPLQVPPPPAATASPVAPERPLTPADSPQGAAPVNTPTSPTPAGSRQPVPVGVQHLPHQPANPSPATAPPDGQEPAADDAQSPGQGPPVAAQPAPPPSPEPALPGPPPAPDVQGPPPGDGTAH